MPLSEDQQLAFDAIEAGESVFLTGSAGSGKSYLTRLAISAARDRYGPGCVFVTASSGIAAWAIGGTTVHSFSGVGLGRGNVEALVGKVSTSKARERWIRAEVLFIDEISMLDGELFNKLDQTAQRIRSDDRPWGGIQLILCGDFFQLPPVSRGKAPTFCFETESWKETIGNNVFHLTTKHRHGSDKRLGDMLDEIRLGTVESEDMFDESGAALPELKKLGLEPTHLYATNRDVDAKNEAELAKLTEVPEKEYVAIDRGTKSEREKMDRDCLAPAVLRLKEGAQVMLLKNLNTKGGLVNGARGVVIGFDPEDDLPIVQFAKKAIVVERKKWERRSGTTVIASRNQIPLKLAWALTVHKSQGMTLDAVTVDLDKCFTEGQGYVGLSRARSLETMNVCGFSKRSIRANPKVKRFYQKLAEAPPPPKARKRKRSVSDDDLDL